MFDQTKTGKYVLNRRGARAEEDAEDQHILEMVNRFFSATSAVNNHVVFVNS